MASKVRYRHQKHDPKVVAALCNALIATSDPKRRNGSLGLCDNVWRASRPLSEEKRDLVDLWWCILRGWPDAVHPLYPVGGPQEYSEERLHGTLWRNARRLALLTYCLEEASRLKVK